MKNKKIFVFGSAGRVGLGLTAELLRNNFDVCVADRVDGQLFAKNLSRLSIDAGIAASDLASNISF